MSYSRPWHPEVIGEEEPGSRQAGQKVPRQGLGSAT